MTREEAKEHIKNQLESYLASKGINTRKNFKCLICGKGDKTPNMGYKNNRIHCFSCGADMDIIDLIGHETGLIGGDLFNYCYEYFNLEVGNASKIAHKPHREHELVQAYKTITKEQETLKTQCRDYTAYIMECKEHITETDYFIKRGLSPATIDRYNLGYDPVKKMVVIPYNKANSYYIARSIDGKAYFKLRSDEAGAEPIYNLQALYNKENKPVFVAEGQIDALSIIEAGAAAIGVGGTNGVNKIINQLKAKPTENTLILSLDNDKAGQEAAAKLETELQAANIKYVKANISGEHKDPNEALTADKDIFLKAIQEAITQAIQYTQDIEDEKKAEAEAEREKYISENSVGAYRAAFQNGINESVNTPAIPTNFMELDKVLDDGLYEGLYILGAISSLGKSSFILQIADQIAQQGQDVLIFSLEMARTELIAKSISRITFLESKGNTANAKTTRGITAGKRYLNYSPTERTLIIDSTDKYFSYAEKNIYIHEGMGNIGVEQIRQTAEKHIKATGNKPVIVIDYLQILAPNDVKATDKQNTDKAVFELKRLSRDFKLPVIGISSLNRENYNSDISMAAFKESGAIEYSSDVLLGLQFEAMSETTGEDGIKITAESINKLKRKQPRKIELKILKNRNGATGDSVTFDYYPMFNYFQETGRKAIEDSPSEPRGKAGRR